MKGGWVYIMTNKPGGTLYVGVAADLAARAAQAPVRSSAASTI